MAGSLAAYTIAEVLRCWHYRSYERLQCGVLATYQDAQQVWKTNGKARNSRSSKKPGVRAIAEADASMIFGVSPENASPILRNALGITSLFVIWIGDKLACHRVTDSTAKRIDLAKKPRLVGDVIHDLFRPHQR